MKKVLTLLIITMVAGCAGQPTPIPDASTEDAQLYAVKCGTCHSVPHPRRHTYPQWEHMMTVMEKQMEHKKVEPLTGEEKAIIMDYLKKNSR